MTCRKFYGNETIFYSYVPAAVEFSRNSGNSSSGSGLNGDSKFRSSGPVPVMGPPQVPSNFGFNEMVMATSQLHHMHDHSGHFH